MKKFSKATRSLIAMLICFTMVMSFVSCGKKSGTTVTFDMQISSSEITKGADVSVFGSVTGSEDTSYEIIIKNVDGSDGASYLDIVQNGSLYKISVNNNVAEEKQVVIEGYPNADPTLVKTANLTIKANVFGTTKIDASMISSKNSARKTYVRKGDEVELKVDLSTTEKDKSYSVSVENPAGMDGLVTVGEDNKITVNGDVTENKKVTITVTSNANPAVTKSFQITVKPPKTAGAVGNLTQATLDKLGNLKLAVSGTLSDVETKNGKTSETVYEFRTYLNASATKQTNEQGMFDDYVFSEATWTSEWNIQNSKNVLSNTYVRGDDGLTLKKFINKNNQVATEVVTDSYSNELTWASQRYWNHLGYLDLSLFEQDPDDENLYTYEMDYGTIESDFIGNTTYTPSEDEYLMMYLAWSLTPVLDEQFYKFGLRLDENGDVSQIIGSTYENNLYSYDDEGNSSVSGSYYTTVTMTVDAYGDEVSAPEITPYAEPTDAEDKVAFGYLKTALDDLAKKDKSNYTFKVKDTSTYAPSYDSSDYEISGSEGTSAPTTSATGTWDGKVHTRPYTSTDGEVGYMGIVAEEGMLLNRTTEYSNGGYRTDVSGFKQNDDGTYEQFEYSDGKLTGKSRKTGKVADRLPGFDVSPYIFKYATMTIDEDNTDIRIYSFSLIDAVIIRDVANEFCMKDYANYATSDAKQAFLINVAYNKTTQKVQLLGVTFAYDINYSTYTGYYQTSFNDFGTATLPDDLFSEENYVTKEFPTSWNYFEAEYRAAENAEAEKTKAGDLFDEVFGTNAGTKKPASEAMPSPMVFSSIFADNFSVKVFHDYFKTGNKTSKGDEVKPEVSFNVWVDDIDLDSNRGLTLRKYNEIIGKLNEEMEKYGFTDYEAGNITDKEGTYSKTRQKCYINENAGDHGIVIRIQNIGYKTFYVYIYAMGDWTPSK